MTFKDYFSRQAAAYAAYRPHYPVALFEWLAQQCDRCDLAWDCATGNGQAAIALADYFDQVIATDASADQLRQAPPHARVTYQVALAEDSGLAAQSVDLITVAQAIHWFNLAAFYREVHRVIKPGGSFAIWCYGRPTLAAAKLDHHLENYYSNTLDDFWTHERRLVEIGYRSLDFPFTELTTPTHRMQVHWTLDELMGYLFTWSATQRYIAAHNVNPLDELSDCIRSDWDGDRSAIVFPITVRAGKVSG
ncbi:MAG: class I SAM-dependent methyltransferase [Cyanobacteria bacterium P01_C01_bin.120]